MAREREVQDHWFKEAKRLGWRSRAAFKLIEIDDKRHVLSRGDRVLDLGAAPGSWMQVASRRIGPKGLVVGIDLQPIRSGLDENNIHIIHGDAAALDESQLEQCGINPHLPFNVVLSDMAPSTTGNRDTDHYRSIRLCQLVLEISARWLGPGGHVVLKTFEGPGSKDFVDLMKTMFETVRPAKPKASRSDSREMFLVGLNRVDDVEPFKTQSDAVGGPPPVSPHWGS